MEQKKQGETNGGFFRGDGPCRGGSPSLPMEETASNQVTSNLAPSAQAAATPDDEKRLGYLGC